MKGVSVIERVPVPTSGGNWMVDGYAHDDALVVINALGCTPGSSSYELNEGSGSKVVD
jgi:hypothetical protein